MYCFEVLFLYAYDANVGIDVVGLHAKRAKIRKRTIFGEKLLLFHHTR